MAALTRDQAIATLSEIVSKGLTHKYYDLTVAHAKLCRQLVTGVGVSQLIESFTPREDPTLLAQRVLITHAITPAVSERIMSHFYHVGRLDSVTKKISYDSKVANFEARIAEVSERAESFFGEDSVDDYLALRLVDLNFLDPNAFILVDFKPFDSNQAKAQPYPLEVPSENAINYSITNNRIDWLVTRFVVKVKSRLPDGKDFDGYQYTMYTPGETYRFTRVDTFDSDITLDRQLNTTVNNTGHKYLLDIYNPKAGEVQGFRVGYKRDLTTNGQTFVTPINGAMCHFMASIQTVSQYDLSKFLHVFPQKIQYVDDCPGPSGPDAEPCRKGELPDGSTCPVCRGTGLEQIHTSAQDAIYLRKPKNPEDYIDLEKLLIYKAPPIEVLTFQQKEVERLEAKILTTIFNAENLVQTTVSKTATEVELSADSRYNTLFPFSKLYSRAWIKCYKLIGVFTDNGEGLQLQHSFPNDFKLRTLGELLATLKSANDSSAPSVMKQRLALEIAQKELADDTLGLLRYQTQVAFTPFQGKTDEQIAYIISNGKCRQEDEILWTHSDTIFDEFEWNKPEFFNLTRKQQTPLVMAAVKTIAAGMTAGAMDFRDALPGTSFGIGDRVEVIPGMEHEMGGMKMGGQGIVEIVDGNAYGIRLDEMPDIVHKWYVGEELTLIKQSNENANAPQAQTQTEAQANEGTVNNPATVLRATVGGGQLIITIQQSVAKAITTYDSGIAMLTLMFGFSDAEAKELLGDPIDLSNQVKNTPITV